MHSERALIDIVNNLLIDATNANASDIHIEPFSELCRIRLRTDGELKIVDDIHPDLALRIITRLKILAKVDISEKRIPQDGRFNIEKIPNASFRLSTCLTIHGEKLTLRILRNNSHLLNISSIGMTSTQQSLFLQALNKSHGLILATGSTGSGKTMTLYSAIEYLTSERTNIITIEDPVEINLPGVNQINVHQQIGLSFPVILRAVLRQDPDILMIGEIRDAETALIALQAAQTGHLVLSTLHANNTKHVLPRLKAMGLPEHYFIDTLSLVISQRLEKLPAGGRIGRFEMVTEF